MNSRMKEYSRALLSGYQLFTQWTTNDRYTPIYIPSETARNISLTYYKKLAHPDLIWFYKQLNCFLYRTRSYLQKQDASLSSLKTPNDLGFLTENNHRDPKSQYIVYNFAKQYLVLDKMAKLLTKLREEEWIIQHPSEKDINKNIPDGIIEKLRNQEPRINIGWNITTRIIHSLCEESMQILEQYCQLLNIIVYDQIELNLDYVGRQINSVQNVNQATSVSHVASLASPLDRPNHIAIEDAIDIMTALLNFANEQKQESHYASRFKENLRNYYDTKGWMIFRNALPYQRFDPESIPTSDPQVSFDPTKQVELLDLLRELEKARYWLTKGLSYDPTNAILYYHLARVHLAILERLWQSRKSTKAGDIAEIAAMFQDHLRQAASCWRHAINYDTSGRLRSSLNWLGQRIEQYSKDWEFRFLSSLRDGLSNSSADE